jgi:hypothetical protein
MTTTGLHNIAIGSKALFINVIFLFKIDMMPKQFVSSVINIPTTIIYYAYYNQNIIPIYYINKKWYYECLFAINTCKALKKFKIMYPRWFTLYQYFKFNYEIPLDIFNHIIQYYIYIKPIK